MASQKPLPATDSASDLRRLTGDDATATFESDPKFVDANPGADGSSENVEEQRDTDDLEDSEDEEDDVDEDDDVIDDEEDDEDEEEEVSAQLVMLADGVGVKDEDDDGGDVEPGVDADALDEDDMDTDRVVAADMSAFVRELNASYGVMRGI